MNTAAKMMVHGNVFTGELNRIIFSKNILLAFVLILSVLVSAFCVVYVKDLERRLFGELQVLQQTRDHLQIEWGQLLLEQSTWAAPTRIQQIATRDLGMEVVTSDRVTKL